MIDRIAFVNNLSCHSDLNTFFDEIMSMYDIVTCCAKDITVSYHKNTDNIVFDLSCNDIEKANNLKDQIMQVEVSKYDSQIFTLNIGQTQNILHVELNNRAPRH